MNVARCEPAAAGGELSVSSPGSGDRYQNLGDPSGLRKPLQRYLGIERALPLRHLLGTACGEILSRQSLGSHRFSMGLGEVITSHLLRGHRLPMGDGEVLACLALGLHQFTVGGTAVDNRTSGVDDRDKCGTGGNHGCD